MKGLTISAPFFMRGVVEARLYFFKFSDILPTWSGNLESIFREGGLRFEERFYLSLKGKEKPYAAWNDWSWEDGRKHGA